MNILHISSAKSWRGGERQVNFLMEGIKSRGDHNFLMSPKNSELSKRSGVNVTASIPFANGSLGILSNLLKLAKFCIRHEIDLIHGHDSHAHTLLWLSYTFTKFAVPSVISKRLAKPIKAKSVTKYNHPRIEKIIGISKAVVNAMEPSILDKQRLEVVYSGIDLSNCERKINESRLPFTVGYVAAFTEEKDHATFVKAAQEILKETSDVVFLLLGDGPLMEAIKSMSADKKDHFKFIGFTKEVELYYKQMDCLLHTSKEEALGTSILDGMKFGLPIVSTLAGGIPEVVLDGKNGFLHEIGDFESMARSVIRLKNSSELYSSQSHMSKELVKKFDKEKMIQDICNIYIDVLNK